ncbi:MAG: hypothetical protein K6U00_05470 [Armatimonadetes bacterium]|nr:hypothetical protein [Armatimonadota bacterium]
MLDSVKRLLYFGIGAAALSADKARDLIDDLVKQGEMTAEEGKKIYEELISRGERERSELDNRIRGQVLQMLKDIGVADQAKITAIESRLEELERRIENLSAKLSGVMGTETPEG